MVNFGPLAVDIGPVVWGTPRTESHFGLRSRLGLAPKRLESRLSHQLMTRLDLMFS